MPSPPGEHLRGHSHWITTHWNTTHGAQCHPCAGPTTLTGQITFNGNALFNGQVAMKNGASILGPVTIKALPNTVALTLLGDNIPPIKEALAVDGNVRIGADRNGFRRNLIVTGQTTLGSGSPGTPIALTTRGGVDVKGHLRALTANFVGSVTVEGNLEVWRAVIARAYYCECLLWLTDGCAQIWLLVAGKSCPDWLVQVASAGLP